MAARRPPAAVYKNDRLAGMLKTYAKCGHDFGRTNATIGIFLIFIAGELRIEDVNAFQASNALRNCSMRVLKQ